MSSIENIHRPYITSWTWNRTRYWETGGRTEDDDKEDDDEELLAGLRITDE
jgi:hypothetical protein